MGIRELIKAKKVEYGDDCARIKYNLEDLGYDVTLSECHLLWREYSDDMCAGWLCLPESDSKLTTILIEYLDDA